MGGGQKGEDIGAVDKGAEAGNMPPPTYDEAKGLTDEEPKVKITPSDTKIEMGKEKEAEAQGFKGLSKDELMQYANDPFWVRLRWFLFIFFWVIWVAMLAASVVIIIYAPKCPSPDPKQWWQKAPIYKADVQNFPSTDEDTIGDLNGFETKVDYLFNAGVGTVYFSNLISPRNFMEVEHNYGTMENWAKLTTSLQERGIRIMVDFSPVTTSNQNMWFEEASTKEGAYKDFYKAGTNQLDLENEAVAAELENVIRFWLKNGVDGFVVQGAESVPKTLMDRFRKVLEKEEEEAGVNKVLVTEDLNLAQNWAGGDFAGVGAGNPVHLAIAGDLIGNETPNAAQLKQKLDDFMNKLPRNAELGGRLWPAFSFSTTSHGENMVDALTMLKMLLPGSVFTQSGEELGISTMDFSKVEGEIEAKHLALYSLLADKLRHQEAILFGELTIGNTFVKNETVFGLTRVKKGSPGYVLLINFGNKDISVDLSDVAKIPASIRVLESGVTMAVSPRVEKEIKKFLATEVTLSAGQAKIFNFVPDFSE